jgi:hypothetical protein
LGHIDRIESSPVKVLREMIVIAGVRQEFGTSHSDAIDTRAAMAPARVITIPTYAFALAKAGTTKLRSMDR